MRVLISGASIAGPVLAYWLRRHGFEPTVVERAPGRRKTGGHAVDLFRPAMDIVERMGALPRILEKNTEVDRLTLLRERGRPVDVDVKRLVRIVSDRHVEIMRDDLSEILQDAAGDVETIFGDSIASITQDAAGVDVTFERGAPRRFDLVVGADGLHSNVRRLVFGEEGPLSHFVGAYLAVLTTPNYLGLRDRMISMVEPGRLALAYSAKHMDDARALFLFRSEKPLSFHHRDVARQKELLREAYRGASWGEVPRLLDELERTPAFYFDTITQLRMESWSRGRVSLVGDAGYSPGPAVGGSTSLAIVGAYVLAGELAAAGGDPARGLAAYEREMLDYVRKSRAFALEAAKLLVPRGPFDVWALAQLARLVTVMPARLTRALANLSSTARLHDSVVLKRYDTRPARAGAPGAAGAERPDGTAGAATAR